MGSKFVDPKREGVTELAIAQGKAKLAKTGTLLMSFKLTLGKVGYAARDIYPNEAIVMLEPDETKVLKEFLFAYLSATDISAGSGQAMKGKTLNKKSLAQIPVLVPSLEEQRRIVDLHGNLSQATRDRNLESFSEGRARVLVATDVAARGVHVEGVSLVIHVDPPAEHKTYLHRSGRTARAGASGDVVTISLPHQRKDLTDLLNQAKISVRPQSVNEKSPEVIALIGEVAAYVKPAAQPAQPKPAGKSTGQNAQRKLAQRETGQKQKQRLTAQDSMAQSHANKRGNRSR
jgi:superfamily II DNA helicase RecQ